MKRTTHKPRHQPTQTNHDRKQPRQQTNRDSKRKGDPKIGLKANYRTIVCGIAACATCLRRCRQLYMTNVCGIAANMLLVCGTAALCYLSAALPPLVVFGSIYNPSPGPASFEPWANAPPSQKLRQPVLKQPPAAKRHCSQMKRQPVCGAWVTSQMIRSMTVQPSLRPQRPRQQKNVALVSLQVTKLKIHHHPCQTGRLFAFKSQLRMGYLTIVLHCRLLTLIAR